MRFPMGKGKNTIDHKDAQILEDLEEQQRLNRITDHAISQTYGPKQPTKFRRKLPGKRHWKNKSTQYAVVRGQMVSREFNKRQAAKKVLDRVYKEKAAKRTRHSLVDNA